MIARALAANVLLLALYFAALSATAQPADGATQAGCGAPPAGNYSIVYTRMPRATTPVPGMTDASMFQRVTGVSRIHSGFAEHDIVIDDLKGGITVVYDCTGSSENCAAMESAVSPDGNTIAFAVARTKALVDVFSFDGQLPTGLKELGKVTTSEIWTYSMVTKKKTRITSGHIDREPVYLSNNKLIITSNRGGYRAPKAQFTYHENNALCKWPCTQMADNYSGGDSLQLYSLDLISGAFRNLTPHEYMALNPSVTSKGDIVYASANNHGQKAYDGTPTNFYWLNRCDSNGADCTTLLGAHGSPSLAIRKHIPKIRGGASSTEFRALRCFNEIFPNYFMGTNYYRGNHTGCLGVIFGMNIPNPRVEGCSTLDCLSASDYKGAARGPGRYVPSSLKPITPYGQDQDATTRFHIDGRAVGKAGYPAPLPGAEYMFTQARGQCYEATHKEFLYIAAFGGEPLCQKRIVKSSKPMITDPFAAGQLETMACEGLGFNCWDSNAIVPYSALFGISTPQLKPPLPPGKCYLNVVDATKAELNPYRTGARARKYDLAKFQGNAVQPGTDYHADNIKALTVYTVEHWRRGPYSPFIANNMGFKSISLYGSEPLQADGSVKMEVPCGEPLIFAATNGAGMVIARDDALRHLVTGETLTCHGCHDGHSEERSKEIRGTAEERYALTMAASDESSATIRAIPHATTFADIAPIVAKCNKCHEDKKQYPYSAWAWDHLKLNRPDQSAYVSKFALESTMYTQCRPTPGHSTGATEAECRLIGNWIDQGTQR